MVYTAERNSINLRWLFNIESRENFMIASKITFINPMGFHSRPCATFAKMAKKYNCTVRLIHNEKDADGRSMLALMKLGAVCGSIMTLQCEGEQEKEASEALGHYLSTLVEEVA